MTVSFEDIPSDILTPGHYVEIDATGAIEGTGLRPHTALLIGYRLAAGTVAENIPKQITKASQAEGNWGIGSQLATMAANFLNVNERAKLVCMGIDESAGTAATGTVTFTASSPATGTVNVYVGGKRYAVPVATTSSATTLAAALVAAITADKKSQYTAANSSGVVTVTYRHKGPEGNNLNLQVSYRDSDVIPSGVTAVAVAMASGATSISLATAIAALAGTQYDTICSGIADATNIGLLEAELLTRWGPMVDIDGHLFVGFVGTHSATTTFTTQPARNSEQSTVVCLGQTPTPPWTLAANVAGLDVQATKDDPARPRTTLRCKDVLAPKASDVWTQAERNLILGAGGATLKLDGGGNVIIERLTTTYQVDAQSTPDPTWLDLSTKRTVSFLRWSWDARITRKYPRHKLANDGTNFGAGQAVVTPLTIRGEAIAWFAEMENAGLVEDAEGFREALIVERNTTDFNRLDTILRPNVINKFVVSATKMQFKL